MASTHPFAISAKEDQVIVLVAGGAGFLGSRLCHYLLRKKIQVICVDDFQTGNRENIADFLPDKNFTLLEHDINNPFPQFKRLDYIFHLAGLEEYLNGVNLSLETLKVNSLGTRNLLELARQYGSKFVFASTCEVFSYLPLATKIAQEISQQQKSFTHHEAKRFSESLIAEYLNRYRLDCRIVRLIDVYGPGMNLEAGTVIARLIKEAKQGEPLLIEGEGLEILYPTFVDDAVEGIIRSILHGNTTGKIYNLLGPQTTVFKFTQTLKNVFGGHLTIERRGASGEETRLLLPPDVAKTREELNWQPKVLLEDGLKAMLGLSGVKPVPSDEAHIEESVEEIRPEAAFLEKERRLPSFSGFAKWLIAFFLFFSAVTFPFWLAAWDIFWGQRNLTAILDVDSFNPQITQVKAMAAETHFLSAQKRLSDLNPFFKLVGQETRIKGLMTNLEIVQKVAAGAKDFTQASQILENLGENILAGGEVNRDQFRKAKIFLAAARENWGEAEAKLKENPNSEAESWGRQLTYYRQLIAVGDDWLEILPKVVALDSRKTYLLLLQNNMEIRPTGGFIGSYGLLTFEKGRLADLKIEDVYMADGQLRGHVEPPEPIKKYLGKEHWFLRDANWDPDFPKSAQVIQWFLEKELGIKTDGVWALDLNLAKDLLSVFGPLELTDYQEKVGSQDLFEKTQKYTELDFFPGSTQKKDFLGALIKTLVEKAKNEKKQWFAASKAAYLAASGGHLMFYFNDSTIEEKILEQGLAGQIKPLPCQGKSNCLGDYLMTVDANLGVNKVNYWIKKEINDKVIFDENGTVSHNLTLNFQNTSSSESWSGGVYKDYLRIYAPAGAILDKIMIGGLATSSAQIATGSADLTKNSGKTVWGVYFEVPSKEKREVAIIYRLPQKFSDNDQNYQFLLQKQAGSQADSLAVEINFPSSWQIKDRENFSGLTETGLLRYNSLELDRSASGRVIYKGDTAIDRELEIAFTK